MRESLRAVLADLASFAGDALFGALARELMAAKKQARFLARRAPAPMRNWGKGLEAEAVTQMTRACSLPIAAAGALMRDAQQGFGLPVGGDAGVCGAWAGPWGVATFGQPRGGPANVPH